MTKKILKILKKTDLKKTFNVFLILGLFLFIGIYTALNTKFLVRGVALEIYGIEDGKVYEVGYLDIEGNARRSVQLLINGRDVSVSQDGDFHDVLVLLPGYNIITVTAEDRFGKITKKTFEVGREKL
jgi:hypothetical protein